MSIRHTILYGKTPSPVRNLFARPFGTADGLFPYGIRLRRRIVRQTKLFPYGIMAGVEQYMVKEIMRKFAIISFCKEAAPKLRSGSYADGITDQSHLLPLTVMAFHVNLPSSDHSEMASDKNRFAGCFLALCAKTLIKTYCDFGNTYSHNRKLLVVLESLERLVKSTSSALLPKKRASVTRQMLPHVSLEEQTLKVLVFPLAKIRHISESAKYSESALSQKMEHLPLVGQTLLNYQLWRAPKTSEIKLHHKDKHFFRICKLLRFGTANPVFPVPNPLVRPFGTANPTFAEQNQSLRPFRSANGSFPYRIDPIFCTGGAFDGLRYRKHPLFCTGGGGSERSGFNGRRFRRRGAWCGRRMVLSVDYGSVGGVRLRMAGCGC